MCYGLQQNLESISHSESEVASVNTQPLVKVYWNSLVFNLNVCIINYNPWSIRYKL